MTTQQQLIIIIIIIIHYVDNIVLIFYPSHANIRAILDNFNAINPA